MAAFQMRILLLGCLFLASYTWAKDTIIVKHYQQQARYEFGLKVLDLALSKLDKNYHLNPAILLKLE